MFYVYILKSKTTSKYYIGSTSNIYERLVRHNKGYNKSTKLGLPWVLVYKEEFPTLPGARRRELKIKSYKGGRAFQKLFS